MSRIACLIAAETSGPRPDADRDLLAVALDHSPRVEIAGPGLVYLDATGLGGLFGAEEDLAHRLVARAGERGIEIGVAIAGSRVSARCACRWGRGVVVVKPGKEAAYLAVAPLSLLDLSEEMAVRLDRWGIRTLGELAALPPAQLFERLGGEGIRLQHLARGEDPRPLRPWTPPLVFEESENIEPAVEVLEPLVAVLGRLAQRIADALVRRACSADQIEWICRQTDGTLREASLAPAVPTSERGSILALVRTSLEARPPRGPVEAVTLRARPVRVPPAQVSLTDPTRPSPRQLAATLARLTALVGPQQIGAPMLVDSHRPDAVTLAPYPPRPASSGRARRPRSRPDERGPIEEAIPALVLRRLRPPLRAAVTLVAGRPVEVRSRGLASRVVNSAGPWRSSGEWWTERPWLHDEWDAELADGTVCRLSHDGSAWWVEGIYD